MNFENFVRDGKITFEGKEHAFHFENNILTIFSNDIEELDLNKEKDDIER